MSKFSRLTLSAVLITAFAVPAMASVPAPHHAPAKAHVTRGPIRHIAATTAAAPSGAATTAPAATAPATTSGAAVPTPASKPSTVAAAPSGTAGTSAAAPAVPATGATPAKPVVKTN